MIKGTATTILSENSERGYYDSKRLSRVRETHSHQLILSGIVVYVVDCKHFPPASILTHATLNYISFFVTDLNTLTMLCKFHEVSEGFKTDGIEF